MSTLSGNRSISDRNKTRFKLLTIHTQCSVWTHSRKAICVNFGSTHCSYLFLIETIKNITLFFILIGNRPYNEKNDVCLFAFLNE